MKYQKKRKKELGNRIKERSICEREDKCTQWPNICEIGVPEGKVRHEMRDSKLFFK